MPFFISFGVTFEICFIILAAFSEIRRYISSLAEAYVYSAIIILSILSVSIQFFFLFGIHKFYSVVDILLVIISIYLMYRNRKILFKSYQILKEFCMGNPFFAFLITFFALCLFVKGFLLPPATTDSMTYHLARVLMMQNDGHYFLQNFADYRQDIMPIGYDILHFLYLRFYTDYGLAFFGFLSYTIVLSGIFALVTKLFSDIKLSKIICFMSASLTMFMLTATSTKNDLILAAIAIVCFLSAYNYSTTRGPVHLLVLIVALVFGLNVKLTFGAVFLPFIFFYTLFLINKFGFKSFIPRITKNNLKYSPFLILPLSIISFIFILLIHNYMRYGAIMGPDFYMKGLAGSDGFFGRSVNLMRYFFQAIGLPIEAGGNVLNIFCDLILGKYKSIGLLPGITSVAVSNSIYDLADINAWYGLLGMPIILSIIFTVFRGKGFLRGIALSIVVCAIIISFQIPWTPWSGRYFASVFAGGMVCFAFLLKWISRKSIYVSKLIIGIGLFIAGCNLFFHVIYINAYNISQLKHHFENRDDVYISYYSKKGWDVFTKKIPHGSKILLISPANSPLFPIYFYRPDLDITVTGVYNKNLYREPFKLNGENYYWDRLKAEDGKTIQKNYDYILEI